MKKIKILTLRLASFAIDVLIMIAIALCYKKIYMMYFELNDMSFAEFGKTNKTFANTLFFLVIAYPLACLILFGKQTVGMKLLGLSIYDRSGLSIEKHVFILRNILVYFSFVTIIETALFVIIIIVIFVIKRRHLVDILIGSEIRA